MNNTSKKQFWNLPESRRLEFKESFPKGDAVAKTIIAFANGAGGQLVFGVKDSPRKIIGIPDDELFVLEEKISSHLFDLCAPTIIPEIYIQSAEGKNLLIVEIFPGSQKPYFLKSKGKNKGTYIRVGSSNRKASFEIIEELERQKRKISFDSVIVYEKFDIDKSLESFIKFFKEKSGLDMDHEHIKNSGLIVCEQDVQFPAAAAILLSDSQLKQRLFPYAKIECARFKGNNTNVFLDQATIEGPVFSSSDLCMDFIKRNISLSSVIKDVYREDTWEYPVAAVREAVNNAVVHRDYSLIGSDIKVAVFDNMLEITSPGPLPDTMPIEKLGSGRSEIRNRVLAPIFKKLKLIESWGTGIQKMKDEVSRYHGIKLDFRETEYSFQVRFIKIQHEKTGQSQGRVRAESGQSQGRVRAESRQSQGRVRAESGQSQKSHGREMTQLSGNIIKLLKKSAMSKSQVAAALGLPGVTGHLNRSFKTLLNQGVIQYTIPEKPQSRLQKYILSKK
ncbi:MAG: putative DNA binding domain-containing protein [Thermodesulfobacteriota bacterium]|nr:putative DNA binding domain-containing protein [Thermodesulfobacteriota bacterium]